MSAKHHIFAVGIESYENTLYNRVAYAENDAANFAKAWQNLGAEPVNIFYLLGAQATKMSVEMALLGFLSKVEEGDTVVVFFAGAAVAKNGQSFFALHDSDVDEIEQTGLAVSVFLEKIAASKGRRTLFFLDTGRTDFSKKGVDSAVEDFSSKELEDFCGEEAGRAVFLANRDGEVSLPSALHQQGIWAQCLLQALSGEEKEAFNVGQKITTVSLQNYLNAALPRLHRATQMGTGGQNPVFLGDADRAFAVADLGDLSAQKEAENDELGSALKEAIFFGKKQGEIRRLTGFQKNFRIPDSHSAFSKNFVKQVGNEDVSAAAQKIHQGLRAFFQYKRKDIDFSSEEGYATIKTPDFDVFVSIEQDGTEAAKYVFYTEIANVRRPEVVMEQGFSELFSNYCDTIVVRFLRPFDLEEKIDEIEGTPELEPFLTYEADCSAFTLDLPDPSIRIDRKSVV